MNRTNRMVKVLELAPQALSLFKKGIKNRPFFATP